MRKIFLVFLALMALCGSSYGEVSYDVSGEGYATKSDIRMVMARIDDLSVSLNKRIDDVIVNTNKRIDDLRGEMNGGFANVRGEMNGGFANVRGEMNGGFANVYREIDNLRHDIYWLLAALGLFLGGPIYAPAILEFLANLRRPKLTSEEFALLREILTREKEKEQKIL